MGMARVILFTRKMEAMSLFLWGSAWIEKGYGGERVEGVCRGRGKDCVTFGTGVAWEEGSEDRLLCEGCGCGAGKARGVGGEVR